MGREPKRSPRRFRRRGRSRVGLWCSLAVLVLLAAYAGVLEYSRPHVVGETLRFDSFVRAAQEDRIEDAAILNQDAVVVGRYERPDGSSGRYNAPYLKLGGAQTDLVDLLVRKRVPLTIDQQFAKQLVLPATLLIPALILVVVFVYLILGYRSGTGLFKIKSGATRLGSDDRLVTFSDVAGQEQAISELRELAGFLTEPERFQAIGAQIPRGVLLYGPPGCGKTLLARALAGEAGASFYSISGSDFVELYVGVGAARVRDLFREARESAPAIVFIDELDSIGQRRSEGAVISAGSEQEQSLNQILAEMDGFSPLEGIVVLGATNRPDVLDPALLRPGRFDRTIGLERPSEEGRCQILSLHARTSRLDPGVDLRKIARAAHGMTGADLANVINEAALLAARERKQAISQTELDEALRRVLEEPERQRRLSMRQRAVERRSTATEERVTLQDVAGADDALEELSEVKDYLQEPERFAKLGARVPRGVLLTGPPGCGKTLLAKAVAGEANAAFFSAAGSEFVQLYVGQGAARVRDLFAEAKALAPAILFIDEIDALGGRRAQSGLDGGGREHDHALNQLLVELDGFEPRSGLILVAATNRPDMLDPALLRPGRFDRQVELTLPDREGRRAILEVHAQGKRFARDADLDLVASVTQGFSGADLANVINEAALLAGRRRQPDISHPALEEAVERVLLGVASRRHIMGEEERRAVAYHEAGHALVGLSLPGVTAPAKVSIVPRGRALGFVLQSDDNEYGTWSRSKLMNQMAMGVAGRVAEQLVTGEPSSGASNDLAFVSGMARRMICDFGMSDALGGVTFHGERDPDWPSGLPGFSEEVMRQIDSEVRRLVEEAHERARQVVAGSEEALGRIAEALLERETLSAEELEALVGRAPVPSGVGAGPTRPPHARVPTSAP